MDGVMVVQFGLIEWVIYIPSAATCFNTYEFTTVHVIIGLGVSSLVYMYGGGGWELTSSSGEPSSRGLLNG